MSRYDGLPEGQVSLLTREAKRSCGDEGITVLHGVYIPPDAKAFAFPASFKGFKPRVYSLEEQALAHEQIARVCAG